MFSFYLQLKNGRRHVKSCLLISTNPVQHALVNGKILPGSSIIIQPFAVNTFSNRNGACSGRSSLSSCATSLTSSCSCGTTFLA